MCVRVLLVYPPEDEPQEAFRGREPPSRACRGVRTFGQWQNCCFQFSGQGRGSRRAGQQPQLSGLGWSLVSRRDQILEIACQAGGSQALNAHLGTLR